MDRNPDICIWIDFQKDPNIHPEPQLYFLQCKEMQRVDNVVTQLGALTWAVAEKFQESDDKKLRIRNLEKVITAPTDYSGTTEAKAAAREKREGQFKTWLDTLTGRSNFHPTYSFYLIDPKKMILSRK